MGYAFHKIWIEQCEGALEIREDFGLENALGYLIGEKLLMFVQMADKNPEFASELPAFVAEVKQIFQPYEIRQYLENIRQVGALGHVCSEEQIEDFREAGAIDEDPVSAAEDILTIERIKEMLLN